MNAEHLERRSIAEQAASWLEELQSADREQRALFLKWLQASPIHVRELLLAARVQDTLRKIDPERRIDVETLIEQARAGGNVRQLQRQSVRTHNGTRLRTAIPWNAAIAASFLVLAAIASFTVAYLRDGTLYETARGEQRMVKLHDGSVIFLNTQTRVKVSYDRSSRDIELREGQALFQVERDPLRPFRVHAGSAVIQAIGTQFDVRLDTGRATVAVVEGAVQVAMRKKSGVSAASRVHRMTEPARIVAGEAAIVAPSGQMKRSDTVNAKAVTAWRQQRLIFDNTPLSEIVDEFNRYNLAPRLRVEGAALGARRFDGSFHALRPESFLTYLSQEQDLAYERHENEVIIRER